MLNRLFLIDWMEFVVGNKKIAVVPSVGLGDALLWLVIAHNLYRNGYQVSFYSNVLSRLNTWFPWVDIQRTPSLEAKQDFIAQFDLVVAEPYSVIGELQAGECKEKLAAQCCFVRMGAHPIFAFSEARLKTTELDLKHFESVSGFLIPSIEGYDNMVEKLVEFCRSHLKLSNVTADIGMQAPANLVFRKNKRRVVLHPLASTHKKCWPLSLFVKLVKRLNKAGWQANLSVPEFNRSQVEPTIDRHPDLFVTDASLEDFACYLYESGYFIGTDFDPSHLASALGLPVLIIAIKKLTDWRVEWSLLHIIKAPFWGVIKTKLYWKYALRVGRVYRAFKKLVVAYES
jgi:heptosyltransferase-3